MGPEPFRLKQLSSAVSLRLDDDLFARTRQFSVSQAMQDPAIAELTTKLNAAGMQHQLLVSCGLLIIHAPLDRVRAVLEPQIVAPPERG